MVIKASSHAQIDALVRNLASERPATRDAAIARLTVIGARAVERLAGLAADESAGPSARASALRVLDSIGDPRALDAALLALNDGDASVAAAAIGVAAMFLRTPRGADVLDRLAFIALDRGRAGEARQAAVRALGELPGPSVEPLLAVLAGDPDAEIAGLAARRPSPDAASRQRPADLLKAAEAGPDLPDDPIALRHALQKDSRRLSLAALHRLIQRLREREASEPARRRPAWTAARAAAHAALASRGSRIALYDVRETLEGAADPLPIDFLAALTGVGDASCLEALAVAYSKASATTRRDEWWPRHLAETFRAIVKRNKITRRHAMMKKIEKRWPDAAKALQVDQ